MCSPSVHELQTDQHALMNAPGGQARRDGDRSVHLNIDPTEAHWKKVARSLSAIAKKGVHRLGVQTSLHSFLPTAHFPCQSGTNKKITWRAGLLSPTLITPYHHPSHDNRHFPSKL